MEPGSSRGGYAIHRSRSEPVGVSSEISPDQQLWVAYAMECVRDIQDFLRGDVPLGDLPARLGLGHIDQHDVVSAIYALWEVSTFGVEMMDAAGIPLSAVQRGLNEKALKAAPRVRQDFFRLRRCVLEGE
jgi:hypothetical protein